MVARSSEVGEDGKRVRDKDCKMGPHMTSDFLEPNTRVCRTFCVEDHMPCAQYACTSEKKAQKREHTEVHDQTVNESILKVVFSVSGSPLVC